MSFLAVDIPGRLPVPQIQQPKPVGCYSRSQCVRTKKITTETRSAVAIGNLAGYYAPKLPGDLNDGFPDRYLPKNDTAEDGCMAFQSPCDAILENNIDLTGVRFISFRNNFNKILGTPFNEGKAWGIDVWREAGVCVFNVMHLENDHRSSDPSDPMTYWGYKFEQLCTIPPDPALLKPNQSLVKPNDEFAMLTRCKIGSHKMLLSAEIDCADPKAVHNGGIPSADSLIELKTCKLPNEHSQWTLERRKMLAWWIQSFLVGVPRIIVGWRDEDGVIQKTSTLPTNKIPKMANADQQKWLWSDCLVFADRLLSWVYANTEDDHRYMMSFDPKDGRRAVQLKPSQEQGTFVPETMREKLQSMQPSNASRGAASDAPPAKRFKSGAPEGNFASAPAEGL